MRPAFVVGATPTSANHQIGGCTLLRFASLVKRMALPAPKLLRHPGVGMATSHSDPSGGFYYILPKFIVAGSPQTGRRSDVTRLGSLR